MTTDTSNKITEYIKAHGQARPTELARYFKYSPSAIHRQLNKLIKRGLIEKIGVFPKTYYKLVVFESKNIPVVGKDQQKFLQKNYLYVSPSGELLEGVTGFWEWVTKTKQEKQFEFLVTEYAKTRSEADKFIKDGLIDATDKLKNTFEELFLDKVYYCDFYSLPKFGKTKLGQLVLYAKQSQNQYLMLKIVDEIKTKINRIIDQNDIKVVGYIPPTVPRKIQFIKEIAIILDLSLPEITMTKISRDVIVPQKTLSTLSERVSNIQETLILPPAGKAFGNILLIDDAVGSGATFNEIARKLRASNSVTGKIYGFAIVGSFKGFEVIREV